MPRLVALDVPAGPAFLDALRKVLDRGDAAFPLDRRLPRRLQERLLEALRPGSILGEDGEERSIPGGRPVEDGDALVVATSGTTGEPKGVVLTLGAVESSARAVSARLGIDPARDRWCCCLPPAHVGGLAVLTRSLLTSTPVEVLPGFDEDSVAEAALRRGATLVSLVPTALRRLGPAADAYRWVVLGGSAPPRQRAANVVATYGSTETGSGVVYDGVPLDGVEVRVGASGEIELRGPMLLRAYRDGRDPRRDGGWLPTGDAGEIRPDGTLAVHGRLDEMIVTGGENVWPEQVEAALRKHAGVLEVGVAGLPDPEWGERVAAWVVPRPDASVPSLEELRELVSAEVGRWAAPRELALVAGLPRTPIGKLRRKDLPGLPVLARSLR